MIRFKTISTGAFSLGDSQPGGLLLVSGLAGKSSHEESRLIASEYFTGGAVAALATQTLDSRSRQWDNNILSRVFTPEVISDTRWRQAPDQMFFESIHRARRPGEAGLWEMFGSSDTAIAAACHLPASETLYVGASAEDVFAVYYPVQGDYLLADRFSIAEEVSVKSRLDDPMLGQCINFHIGDRLMLANDAAWERTWDLNFFMDFFSQRLTAFQLVSQWQALAVDLRKDAIVTIIERLS